MVAHPRESEHDMSTVSETERRTAMQATLDSLWLGYRSALERHVRASVAYADAHVTQDAAWKQWGLPGHGYQPDYVRAADRAVIDAGRVLDAAWDAAHDARNAYEQAYRAAVREGLVQS